MNHRKLVGWILVVTLLFVPYFASTSTASGETSLLPTSPSRNNPVGSAPEPSGGLAPGNFEASPQNNHPGDAPVDTIQAVVVRSWDGCESDLWDELNTHWSSYGSTPVYVNDSNPYLCSGTITYANLVASGADVVILSDPGGGIQQYSASEIAALQQYAQAGHNLIGTYILFQWYSVDNRGLAPLFGVSPGIVFNTNELGTTPTYNLLEPGNVLFRNMSNPYVSNGYPYTQVPADNSWDASDLNGGRFIAKTADRRAAIILYNAPSYNAIYITNMPEFGGGSRDYQFLYNAITYGGGGSVAETPIIFIPGLMGSRLFNTINNQEDEVWADTEKISSLLSNPHPLMVLELASDGSAPARDDAAYKTIHTVPGTAGIITRLKGQAWGQNIDEDFYDTIIKHFEAKGYTENVDLWAYPYDWRKDLRKSADGLDALVQKVLTQTGRSQVYLVAHSLGGLVTRQYISDQARASKVKSAVILGTPFLGTPKAFYALQEGDCINKLPVIGYCIPKKEVIKALAPNFPAFYQIMPSEAYLTVKGGGFYGVGRNIDVTGVCTDCLTYNATYQSSIAANLNSTLAADAKAFHTQLDAQSGWNNVPVHIIGGQNQSTIVGIRQYVRSSWLGFSETTIHEPIYTTAGDGTVSFLSVSLADSLSGVNLRGSATFKAFDADHGALVKKSEILDYLDNLLGLTGTLGSVQTTGPVEVVPATGAQIIGYGAAEIHVYDSYGKHTGPTGTGVIEQSIPGSAYFNQGDLTTVGLVGGRTYIIEVVPTGLGPVDLSLVRSTLTETITTNLYLGINVTDQSRIKLTGDPYVVDTWQLDVTGTGSDLQPVNPTTILLPSTEIDTITPSAVVITLDGFIGQDGWYTSPVTVTLSATDNAGGAGIARIEYSFNRDGHVRIYSGPFVVNPEQVRSISAIAVDGMGNTQAAFSQVRLRPELLYLPLVKK